MRPSPARAQSPSTRNFIAASVIGRRPSGSAATGSGADQLAPRSSENQNAKVSGTSICRAFGLIWIRTIYFDWQYLMVQNCQSQI